MTPEQLEAHRVRFEQPSDYPEFPLHPEPRSFAWSKLEIACIEKYAKACVDADRAQRSAQPPQQSAQPVADGCVFFVDPEIIRWTLAGSPRAKPQLLWLAKTARPEDGLTMPLYAAAQPVEVPAGSVTSLLRRALSHIRWTSFGECRAAGHDGPPPTASEVTREIEALLSQPAEQRPESVIVPRSLEAAKLMVLLGTNWLTAYAPGELKVAPVEVQRVPLTAAEIEAIAKPFICTVGGYSQNEPAIPDNGKIEDFVQAVEAAHQIGVKK